MPANGRWDLIRRLKFNKHRNYQSLWNSKCKYHFKTVCRWLTSSATLFQTTPSRRIFYTFILTYFFTYWPGSSE